MLLQAESISKQFSRRNRDGTPFFAVKPTSLSLEAGIMTEIQGRSGSGKSTLLNMLAGLLAPTEGKVLLDGTDLYSLGDSALSRLRNRKIGVIPQGQTALHTLNVFENIRLPSRLFPGAKAGEGRVLELLELVGISHLRDARARELSGGEMRRMAIARALVNDPKILLCDEPTGDLDDENTTVVLQLLQKTARAGTAVLLVTHEAEAEKYADVVYRMNAGELSLVSSGR